jgi:triosephosphate isomerase
MNPQTVEEAISLSLAISSQYTDTTPCDCAIFTPPCFIQAVSEAVGCGVGISGISCSGVQVGSEFTYYESKGAYTGQVSAPMVKSLGCFWALSGHSERRTLFGDSDDDVNKQVLNLLKNDMGVILCVGETKLEHDEGHEKTLEVVANQVILGLQNVSDEAMRHVIIAYEPVWSIGTGDTCPPPAAQIVHRYIRDVVTSKYGESIGNSVRILYGGSVTERNVDEIMGETDVDGCLVGGASLSAERFGRIMNFKP